MSDWQTTRGGWSCYDCGSFTANVKEIESIKKDCTRSSCTNEKRLYAALNGVCECGWVEADAGTLGVYCTNPNCPVERRIMGSIKWFLRAVGVSRVADNDKVLMISFNRKPTDDELREIHDKLRK